jgi:hypothetical protein
MTEMSVAEQRGLAVMVEGHPVSSVVPRSSADTPPPGRGSASSAASGNPPRSEKALAVDM